MNTDLPTRRRMDGRLGLVLPADEKRAVFELAAEHGIPASEYVRAACSTLGNFDSDERRKLIAEALVR